MNVAVIKLGSRVSISSSGTSGGTGETLSIIKLLTNAGASVSVFTKVLDSDIMPNTFKIFDIEQYYSIINNLNFDCLVVLNGNVNYFGGIDDRAQTLNYYIINNFIGKVFYVMCDCNLLLKQIWPSIENKSWSSNYNKDDILITRDDITYISQARFVHKVKEKANNYVHIDNIVYYPLEKFPLVTMQECEFNSNPEYDLLYGGTFRGGRREDDMIKFYFNYGDEYNVEMFGKISIDNFNKNKINKLIPPKFSAPVQYDKFSDKMLNSRATVIIGDSIYKSWGDLAQRIYESIMIGNITLIDSSYDFKKRVFGKDSILSEFNYVSSAKDVCSRLDKILDNNYRKYLLNLQRECVKIDIDEYCNEFLNLLR